MPILSKWHRYLRFWRTNVAADVDDELEFHVDERTQELSDAGLDPVTARRQALQEFGDVDRARRTLRAMGERHAAWSNRATFAGDLARDIRVAVRSLARSPGLVAVVVLTFALGIGITSAIYSVVDAFLFQPLSGANGPSLVVLGRTDRTLAQPHDLSYPDFKDYRADTAVFESLAAFASRIVEIETNVGANRLWIDDATANYFSVLGLPAFLGRTFSPGDDDGVLSHPSIVLTYKAWKANFAGDSSVVGRVIRINDHPVTVIGVMPAVFHGVRPLVDIDGIACFNQVSPPYGNSLNDRAGVAVYAFGRLRHGVSLSSAREAVRLKARQLEHAYPTTNKDVGAALVPEHFARPSMSVSNLTPRLAAVFMTLVTLVLLVACANVASLLLARVVVRGRELAIRAAIGASHWRLVRQVLVECALLATLGGIGAVAVAYVALRAVESIHIATDLPVRWGVALHPRVMLFTAAATVLAAIAAGFAPALAARKRNLNDVLKSSAGSLGTTSHRRLRATLVAGQIAVSVVVLVSAGLLARSAAYATHMTLGFRADHVLMLSTALRTQSFDTVRGRSIYREALRRATSVPGVRFAALTRYVPFGFSRAVANVVPLSSPVPVPANGFNYFYNLVGGDYFPTMGIPLLHGREFTEHDGANALPVAIVNDAFAKATWPGQTAIGKRFHIEGTSGPILEIVGVVGDMQDLFPGEIPKPYIFRPIEQSYQEEVTLLVRTAPDPSSLVPPLRALFAGLDRSLPVFDVRTMDEHLRNGQAFLFTRIGSAFSMVFGLLALALATVGVYGVVSYSVAQRTREIGVRVALGARLPTILRLVVGQGMKLAWTGVSVGIVLSVATTGVLSSVLYGVAPHDPVVLASVVGVLTFVTVLASLVPARRATRIDPLTALRWD